MSDKSTYVDKLKSSSRELKELIEEVIIPETWFYRDQEPFKAIRRYLVNQWVPKHKYKLFKVLSAPCSSGEEPYSLAMTLLNSELAPDKFKVIGVDISRRSIDKARKGIYSEHSFRGTDLVFQTRFFKKNNSSFILDGKIREKVQFYCGNILDNSFMDGLGLFDVIFFRNVLIYFDTLARHKAIATLYKLLTDDG
ncbi:MAG: chemotaxis protein CheR, partial [Deltaproteobacteria bacterium]|nr:chemotaxis protein CheR [Deltaproteobacteria bacterium]